MLEHPHAEPLSPEYVERLKDHVETLHSLLPDRIYTTYPPVDEAVEGLRQILGMEE